MGFSDKLPALIVTAVVIGGLGIGMSKLSGPSTSSTIVDVTVPQLSSNAKRGQTAFSEYCAVCHGDNASGSDKGPPLIHNIYNPGHHADGAFFLAAKRGVRSHHWPYGDMPPQPQVNERQMANIVTFVRELQAANGILARPHQM
ncbi:MAG: cytochrome c [Magnetovibrio sp.]|nr:cytochrome c [Magnetovibrio sp.]